MAKTMEDRFFAIWETIEPHKHLYNLRMLFDEGARQQKLQVIDELEEFAERLRAYNPLTGQARYDQIKDAIELIKELQ